MNIVFIGPFGLQPKGTMSVRAMPLARSLASRGHQVTVLIPPWDDPDRAGRQWEEAGVRVINLSLPPRWPLFFHIGLSFSLIKQALALRPAVIHCFKPKAYAGLAHFGLWWLKRLGLTSARLVVDADDWEQAWNEVSAYSPVQKKFFAWQERWGLRHAEAVTAASRALVALVTTSLAVESARIFYLPNGCEPIANQPNAGEITLVRRRWQLADAPVILLYSRFLEFRFERIINQVKLIAAQVPQARWLVIGQGFDSEEQRLAAQLAGAGLSEYARFTGWPVEPLTAHLQAADVAVYPYDNTLINRTKCSVKLIELLALALPVVADAVGQNNEYIQHNHSGLLVPAEDDAAFSQAVVTLLQQPERRQEMGQAAAQFVREKFTWAALAQTVEEAYG